MLYILTLTTSKRGHFIEVQTMTAHVIGNYEFNCSLSGQLKLHIEAMPFASSLLFLLYIAWLGQLS